MGGKKAELAGALEGMGAVALGDLEAIKAAEEEANAADAALKAFMAKGAKEKAEFEAELATAKADMTAERDAAAQTLADQKATFESATGDYNAKKAGCIGMESSNAAGKGDVLAIADDIAKLDKAGTALLRDKKEMLAAVGHGEALVYIHGRLAHLLNA